MWFVVRDCLGLSGFPSAEKNIRARLDRLAENNPEWKRKREGTKAFEYHIDCLPAEAQKVLRKRLTHQVLEDAQLPAVVEQKAVKNVAVRDELEVMVKCPELALREVQALTDKQKAIADARIPGNHSAHEERGGIRAGCRSAGSVTPPTADAETGAGGQLSAVAGVAVVR
ncbi:DNA-binding protein [Escherichia coli]|uniref:DNA-binding protein n=1 Tax=Escherichia coli TaxID=562 RepID=UPI00207751D9|nr:DNA-binding protein [Escherichia coli]